MPHIEAQFVQQVPHVLEREREPDVHHDRQANDFRAALKAFERVGVGHGRTVRTRPAPFNLDPSDKIPLSYLESSCLRHASCHIATINNQHFTIHVTGIAARQISNCRGDI